MHNGISAAHGSCFLPVLPCSPPRGCNNRRAAFRGGRSCHSLLVPSCTGCAIGAHWVRAVNADRSTQGSAQGTCRRSTPGHLQFAGELPRKEEADSGGAFLACGRHGRPKAACSLRGSALARTPSALLKAMLKSFRRDAVKKLSANGDATHLPNVRYARG